MSLLHQLEGPKSPSQEGTKSCGVFQGSELKKAWFVNSRVPESQQVSFKEHAEYHAAIESEVCKAKQLHRASFLNR